ncbi:MAG: ATP-dependent acyl-CoA ligase [Chloroflexi bacterium]|nr:MAG: ATP-dependent acyl-CoA ligase [Chloroflexota bacterium]
MASNFATVPELLSSAANRFGDTPAIVTAESSESFRQLADSVRGAAAALGARGLRPGDRVLIAAPNSPALVHVWLGTIWAGGIPAAVNPESTPAEIDYLVDDLQPRITLHQEELELLGATTTAAAGATAATVDPMDVAAIVYTSGTTSRPKGVMVRHAAYTETGRSFPSWIGLAPTPTLPRKRGRERQVERLWACLPLFHINAQAYSLMSSLAHGFALALSPKFHATTFWQEARALNVTAVNLVGAMLDFIAQQPETRWVESPLRTIYAAPGPDPEQRAALEARFGVRIVTGYGLSENPFGCIESPTSRSKRGSIGRPRQPVSGAFTNELRIVRPDGADAPDGEVGELCFRNPVITPGYWKASEITREALRDGWLRTGDAGTVDRDGDVFLTGRYKEMIRRRGENIAPAEVEDALRAHPAVRAVAVFGISLGLREEEVLAAVVLKDGEDIDEAALRAFVAGRLAAHKIPSRILFRDSLPMTTTQRVAKDLLRQEYGRAASRD